MTTFTTVTRADIDPAWIEDLLVTAFDRQWGGCNYWLAEERDRFKELRWISPQEGPAVAVEIELRRTDDWPGRDGFALQGPARPLVARLDKHSLEYAWQRIVNEQLIRTDLVAQLVNSQTENDLDVDADAADCLVQIALFGEVVYS